MRVLLAEDNTMNIDLALAALASEGYEVSVARDGVAARERALAEDFDLFILDIQMPKLDGLALCRELRAAGIRKPIMALSAAAMPEDVTRGQAAGFDAYLTKPMRVGELREVVRRLASS